MDIEFDLDFLFTEVTSNIYKILQNATSDNIYKTFNIDKEDERLFDYYLNLENIVFNYELLLSSNVILVQELEEKLKTSNDPQEIKLLENIINILTRTNFSDVSDLVVEGVYLVNKKDANLFRGAIKNTPFSVSNKLNDLKRREEVAGIISLLNTQIDRINLYAMDLKMRIDNKIKKGLGNIKNYQVYLQEGLDRASREIEISPHQINQQAIITKMYFESYLENYLKHHIIEEPLYDFISRYTNKKLH